MKRGNRRRETGQAILEYVMMLVLFAILTFSLVSLGYYFSLYGGRQVDLVSIEYP